MGPQPEGCGIGYDGGSTYENAFLPSMGPQPEGCGIVHRHIRDASMGDPSMGPQPEGCGIASTQTVSWLRGPYLQWVHSPRAVVSWTCTGDKPFLCWSLQWVHSPRAVVSV